MKIKTYSDLENYMFELPKDCISNCTHQGSCDNDVEYWVKKLEFTVDREVATKYLKETGAWSMDELTESTQYELDIWVLWVLCGTASDIIEE